MRCRSIYLAKYTLGGWQIIKCRRFRFHWGQHWGNSPWSPARSDSKDVFSWSSHNQMPEGK